ncbi:zinc-binding dehydrogenase [Phenylobacterium sp.]|uniref:quinone oxidoreductase family protein n=1 Tax=Phenylobacterium sp. TaxID=1871053 RepID=UPI0030F43C41
MKAAQLSEYGPAENFQIVDLPKPSPRAGEVLIEVAFAGLRWGDIMGRKGIPVRTQTGAFVPGMEAVGVVAELGEGVSHLTVGDRVVAQPQGGAYAAFLRAPVAAVGRVPDHVPLETMLVTRVNLPTAYMLVYEWAKVQEGETVLVHAAAGGVGMLVVQILKRKFQNVTVIGLAGSDEKVAQVLANGADHAINYKTHDYVAEVGKIAGVKPAGFAPGAPPAGVHVALNGVGGATLKTDRRVIRRLGRWVLYGTPGGTEAVNPFEYSYDSIAILPFSIIPYAGSPEMARAQAYVKDWLKTEPLTAPVIHPIEDIAKVQAAMERGETSGKVVFRL